jgi:hypothetical protein
MKHYYDNLNSVEFKVKLKSVLKQKREIKSSNSSYITYSEWGALQDMEFLEVKYLVLCSFISMLYPQPSTLIPCLYILLRVVILFHSQKSTTFIIL